jgi:hypothetical protein
MPSVQLHASGANLLAGDGYDNIEGLSGMSHLSGILVEVRRAKGA